jgi:Tfp pilus assembly protein PilP
VIRTLTGLALASALILSACGESAEEKAQTTVCSARADIKKQVDELKGLTATTVSLDGVQANLKAIRKNLEEIRGAQGDLKGDRKQQAKTATEAFAAQVKGVGQQLLGGLTASEGKQQIQTALDGLAAGYKSALGPIDCS